ncbi:MAG: hypothetical protein AB7F32_01815 [Victivallaceae bacterium]
MKIPLLFCCFMVMIGMPLKAEIFSEYQSYPGKWIWPAAPKAAPELIFQVEPLIRVRPGVWGEWLVFEMLNRAANYGFREIAWVVAAGPRRLEYPSPGFPEQVVKYPAWGCDFAEFDYPAAALTHAGKLNLRLRFVVPEEVTADFRSRYPSATVITAIPPGRTFESLLGWSGSAFPAGEAEIAGEFEVTGQVQFAELAAMAHGTGTLELNGTVIAQLNDSRMPKRIESGELLSPGKNRLVFRIRRAKPESLTGIWAVINWRDASGEHYFTSDENWQSKFNGTAAATAITGLDRGAKRFLLRNVAVSPTAKPDLRSTELAQLVKPVAVSIDHRPLSTATAAPLFDGSLADTPNLRTPARTIFDFDFGRDVELEKIRIYGGYIANAGNISTAMSPTGAKWEAIPTSGPPLVLVENRSLAEIPSTATADFNWEFPLKTVRATHFRLTVPDSSDSGMRFSGKISPDRRGIYWREIEFIEKKTTLEK